MIFKGEWLARERNSAIGFDLVPICTWHHFQQGLAYNRTALQASMAIESWISRQEAKVDHLAGRIGDDLVEGKALRHVIEDLAVAELIFARCSRMIYRLAHMR